MWNDRYIAPCSLWGRAAFKNIFPSPAPPPAPTPPTVTPPPPMPDSSSPGFMAAGMKAAAEAAKAGRSSTVLTQAGANARATLAGSSYGGMKLGSG